MSRWNNLNTQDKLDRLLKLEAKLREQYPSRFKPNKEQPK